ncbi:MAG: hypothetical protein MJ223_03515 [Mycoplasmoidaceae bacterium]|nr:hypothetical protein [Mycoplasmoidaceae bacterium]
MFTYDIKNIEVGIDETNRFLTYKDEGHIIGIEKIRSFDGEHMNSIETIDQPIESLPKNSKN